MPGAPKHRSFCFVIHYPGPVDMWRLRNELEPKCSVFKVALEKGEQEHKWHIQGYCTIKHDLGPQRFKFFHDIFDTKYGNAIQIKVAGGRKGAQHEYIIRGINEDGSKKKWNYPIWDKDLHEKEETAKALLEQVVSLLEEGATCKQLMRRYEYISVFSKHKSYLKSMEIMFKTDKMQVKRFNIEQFTWQHNFDSTKFTILWGDSGIGKTQWAKAHFIKPLLVSHVDTLKEFDDHDAIIFDDMDFGHWQREWIIQLVDNEEPREIHCRFHNFVKPPGIQCVATTNNYEGNIFGQYLHDPAIQRRIEIVHVSESPIKMEV